MAKIEDLLRKQFGKELEAANNYFIKMTMCDHWEYNKMYVHYKNEYLEELIHAENLHLRIMQMDAVPFSGTVSLSMPPSELSLFLSQDKNSEMEAIEAYKKIREEASKVNDVETMRVASVNNQQEEESLEWIKAQELQIFKMGKENWLSTFV